MRRSSRRRQDDPITPATSVRCEHLAVAAGAPEPSPQSVECQSCAELGENNWAHLRMCLTCGRVGCCDSSPRRHATGHFEETGHPVMRSIEPGERWRWCYIDTELQP